MSTNWVNRVNAILTLENVPDERILSLVPWGERDASAVLGSSLANTLSSAGSDDYEAAVTHFIAARLILSSRPLVMGLGFPDTHGAGTSWGQGEEKRAAMTDLLNMAGFHQKTARDICSNLKAETALTATTDEAPWFDI